MRAGSRGVLVVMIVLTVLTVGCASHPARAAVSSSASGPANPPIRIGVLAFGETGDRREGTNGPLAASVLRRELIGVRRFELVEEDQMTAILAQIAKGHTRDYSEHDAVEVGRLLSAQYICFGDIGILGERRGGSVFSTEVSATVRMVDVETSRIVFQEVAIEQGNTLGSCIERAVSELGCKLRGSDALAGIVLDSSDPKGIVVALGEGDGLERGDELVVRRSGGLILNPDTGEFVPRPEVEVGTVRVVQVAERTSLVQAKDKRSTFRLRDRLERKSPRGCGRSAGFGEITMPLILPQAVKRLSQ